MSRDRKLKPLERLHGELIGLLRPTDLVVQVRAPVRLEVEDPCLNPKAEPVVFSGICQPPCPVCSVTPSSLLLKGRVSISTGL